jgi:peptidoglycan/LPS O-acetylase OafA/YrhL
VDVPTTPPPREQVLAIDILRFAAAMLVVAHHYGTLATRAPDPRLTGMIDLSLIPAWLSPLTNFGWVGVEIFFVISGYVIAASAERSSPQDFLRRRYLRLAPAAWVCGTFTFMLLLIVTKVSPMTLSLQWLRTIALSTVSNTIDPSYWTISIEIAFYAIVATQLRGPNRARRLTALALIIGLVSTVFAVLVQRGATDPQPAYYWQLLLVQYGCFFALGMIVRTSQVHGWSRWRVAFSSLQTLVCMMEIRSHTFIGAIDMPGQISPQIVAFLISLAFVVTAPSLQFAFVTPGMKRAVVLLGKSTYPLYLIHQTAGFVLIGYLLSLGTNGPAALLIAAFTAIATAMTIAAYVEPAVRAHAARLLFSHAPRPDIPPIASPSAG